MSQEKSAKFNEHTGRINAERKLAYFMARAKHFEQQTYNLLKEKNESNKSKLFVFNQPNKTDNPARNIFGNQSIPRPPAVSPFTQNIPRSSTAKFQRADAEPIAQAFARYDSGVQFPDYENYLG